MIWWTSSGGDGYLDTSAFVPLLIEEPTSAACRRFWDDAGEVVSSRLL